MNGRTKKQYEESDEYFMAGFDCRDMDSASGGHLAQNGHFNMTQKQLPGRRTEECDREDFEKIINSVNYINLLMFFSMHSPMG
ncbi:MAG: hypothetical protein JRJ85_23865 [Deltaproteobacteria bacterium]|nr:hypothetical protein [Deltaproteobacteria bacterium]